MNHPSKVYIRLAGGLGNQLFQLGFAAFIANKLHAALCYSTAGLRTYQSVHDYVLGKIVELSPYATSTLYSQYIVPLRLPRLLPFQSGPVSLVTDKNMQSLLQANSGHVVMLDGYFQEVPLSWLKTLPLTADFHGLTNAAHEHDVAIHVRGGDFLKLGFTNYRIDHFYGEALARMASKTSMQNPVVITDDPSFVAGLSSLKGIRISEQDTVHDFAQLVSAKNRIFASSTFALAAAALGDDGGFNISTGTWMKGDRRTHLLDNECTISLSSH